LFLHHFLPFSCGRNPVLHPLWFKYPKDSNMPSIINSSSATPSSFLLSQTTMLHLSLSACLRIPSTTL
ncbi:hypothetical protein BYT27DRAFT_7093167, partial [Phlegmacium glaucopus]